MRIVRIYSYKLRMVNIIRDKLSVHVAERVVNVMVTGNLDYCNFFLHSITAGQLGRLQKIQNTAAAKLWNAEPFQLKLIQNIDSLKSKLKRYLCMLNLFC